MQPVALGGVTMLTARAMQVAASPGLISVTGDVQQQLTLRADKMLQSLPQTPKSRALDLLTIAAGTYAIDRVVKRKMGAGNRAGIRNLRPQFAVHDLAFWSSHRSTLAVTEILHFLTGDDWQISFEQATGEPVYRQQQERLPFVWQPPTRVALYSGGLDSAAGLANLLLTDHREHYLLVTVRNQMGLRARCQEQIRTLSAHLNIAGPLRCTLATHLSSATAGIMSAQECSQRSRGFLFCATAALAAKACLLSAVEVLENGVGAINLPLTTSGLSGGMATRGAHPTFLNALSNLCSEVMEQGFNFTLPFMNHTKGEMLAPLIGQGLGNWAELSHSCIHTSVRKRGQPQCGECPACIERRQAFAVAGHVETHQYNTDIFRAPSLKTETYLRRYWDEAVAWQSNDTHAMKRLQVHLTNTQVPMNTQAAVIERQRRHADEVVRTFACTPLLHKRRSEEWVDEHSATAVPARTAMAMEATP